MKLHTLLFGLGLLAPYPSPTLAAENGESNCFFIFCGFACLAGDTAACKKGQSFDPVEYDGGGGERGDFGGTHNGHSDTDTGDTDTDGSDTDGNEGEGPPGDGPPGDGPPGDVN